MTDLEHLRTRAAEFSCASIVAAYPDHNFVDAACALLDRDIDAAVSLDDRRSTYLRLFENGEGRCSLHETEYGRMRALAKGHDLADINGFYQAFDMNLVDGDGAEMADHLAVELEFYTLLLFKEAALRNSGDHEGVEIVVDARKKFLEDHLGRLGLGLASRVPRIDNDTYASLVQSCCALIASECAVLQAKPAPLDFYESEETNKPMECGGLPVLN